MFSFLPSIGPRVAETLVLFHEFESQGVNPAQMTLHFGVLLVDPRGHGVQFQDVSPVDLIANLSNEYLSLTPGPNILDPIRPFGIDLAMHYIADSLEPVRLTAGVTVVPTDTYETCPALDYLWIPGPSPMYQPSAAEITFVRARYAEVKTVFSICTGSIVLGASGIADGARRGTEALSRCSSSTSQRCSGRRRTGGWLMRRRSCGHVGERRRGLICSRRILRSTSTLL